MNRAPNLINLMAKQGCFPSLQCLQIPQTMSRSRTYFQEKDLPSFLNSLYAHLECLDIDFWSLHYNSILLGPNNPFQLNTLSNLVVFRMLYARTRPGLETVNYLLWLTSMLQNLSGPHPLRMIILAGSYYDQISSKDTWCDFDDALHAFFCLKLPDFRSLVLPLTDIPTRLEEYTKITFRECLPRTSKCGQLRFDDVDFEGVFWRHKRT
ncbi:hypothetical protein DL96DRAFT_1623329 [Flagelloscypha sp. PMI_526]|nr:hypothetical protein DL96DRAFT_1623329 [Flagelloscypha sp. PMI_526]